MRERLQIISGRTDTRLQEGALEVIQQALEAHLIETLTDANLMAIHAKRITVQDKDVALVHRVKRR